MSIKMRRRHAYVMRVQGYVYREIGERLGVSESTASNDVQWIEREQERLRKVQPRWLELDGP